LLDTDALGEFGLGEAAFLPELPDLASYENGLAAANGAGRHGPSLLLWNIGESLCGRGFLTKNVVDSIELAP
jgi:hypothetical protein